MPPLRYDVVRRIERDFPALTECSRAASPTATRSSASSRTSTARCSAASPTTTPIFGATGTWLFGDESPARSRAEVMQARVPYARSQLARGAPLRAIARHVLGLDHGCSGGRASGRSCPTRRSSRMRGRSSSPRHWRPWNRRRRRPDPCGLPGGGRGEDDSRLLRAGLPSSSARTSSRRPARRPWNCLSRRLLGGESAPPTVQIHFRSARFRSEQPTAR